MVFHYIFFPVLILSSSIAPPKSCKLKTVSVNNK
jgi:hypothetical protein